MALTLDSRRDPRASALGFILARPRHWALLCVALLSAAGWAYLGLMLAERGTLDAALRAALCGPTGPWGGTEAALVFAMWSAMVLAMMLPSALPMIATYADIAETAATKGEPVVPTAALIAGFTAVWLGFALAAAALQGLLTVARGADIPTSPLVAGGLFILSGLYQFSALKHACLTQCQRPFPFFFANWTDRPWGVMKLGLRQGAYCVGCCWAMMLLMFAVGVMNLVWMAALGVVMAIEKMAPPRFSRALGVALTAIGSALVLAAAI
jgi:predicted metal-binding membrane protein